MLSSVPTSGESPTRLAPKGSTMTKPKSESQKGEKRRYTREAIESLGLDAKYVDAAKWVKDRHGIEVSDPTFYHLRKEMQLEASGGAGQPSVAPGKPTPASPAASQAEAKATGPTAQETERP